MQRYTKPVTLEEAARTLGISVDAVRKRMARGKLERTDVAGQVMVYLPAVLPTGTEPDDLETAPSGPEIGNQMMRLVAENAVLRDRNRQLTAENRTLMRMVMSREQELEALRNQPSGPA